MFSSNFWIITMSITLVFQFGLILSYGVGTFMQQIYLCDALDTLNLHEWKKQQQTLIIAPVKAILWY